MACVGIYKTFSNRVKSVSRDVKNALRKKKPPKVGGVDRLVPHVDPVVPTNSVHSCSASNLSLFDPPPRPSPRNRAPTASNNIRLLIKVSNLKLAPFWIKRVLGNASLRDVQSLALPPAQAGSCFAFAMVLIMALYMSVAHLLISNLQQG